MMDSQFPGKGMLNIDPKYSVVVCTHNPRVDYFKNALESISRQTIDKSCWELVLLDNASEPPLLSRGLVFPEGARVVSEESLGFNRARRAGVLAARGEWVVYVDDDNVLDEEYLRHADSIMCCHPELDFFCGQIDGLFEVSPPAWSESLLKHLAIISFEKDCFTNELDYSILPVWTAGMVCRKRLLVDYFRMVDDDPFRLNLNRCEDHDFVDWAVRVRRSTGGRFRRLRMKHQIPAGRFDSDYLKRLLYERGVVLGQMAKRNRSTASLRLQIDRLRAFRNLIAHWFSGDPEPLRSINIEGKRGYFTGLFKAL